MSLQMAQFQLGDLVRLKLCDEIFKVAAVLPGGKLKLAHPRLQLITGVDGVEAAGGNLDELPYDTD
jgi:hypothetical protein